MVLPSHLIRHSYAFPLRLSLPSDEDYKTPFLKRLQRWVKVLKYANLIDQTYMSTFFRRLTGISPVEYRRSVIG